jgi:hypothetical protein
MARKFYRTVIQVEILSEEPYSMEKDLVSINYDINEGDCSGDVRALVENQEVDGPQMARLLIAQNSDPEFFNLDSEGKDLE